MQNKKIYFSLVLFSLVTFLAVFQKELVFEKFQMAVGFFDKDKKQEAELEVKGIRSLSAEVLNERSSEVFFNRYFPIANYQPIRKEGTSDLQIASAHSSLVLDVESGTILHYQNAKEVRQIASLTKLMTAVMVMENVKDLDEEVIIDEDMMYVDGTKVGCPRSGYCIGTRLQKGERISVRSLLKAMLMNSANDAATALGKHIGGSVDNFVVMMNKRARELGLMDTHFCTPSGLEIDGEENKCYSTAYDIGRIAAHSMKYDTIWNTLKLREEIIYSVDGVYSHELRTTNRLLGDMSGCLGGKTGFTPLAGESLIMGVVDETNKHKIVTVLLDDPNRWSDVRMMSNWAFQSFDWE